MARFPNSIWMPWKPQPDKGKNLEHFRIKQPKGLLLHITSDRGNSLNGILSTFNASPIPSHFGITTDGAVGQFIDTDYHDWSTEWTVSYFSVECAATQGDSLTYSQLGAVAQLYAWLNEEHKIKIKLAANTSVEGLTYHSMGKTGHPFCPGIAVINQREQIIELTNYSINNRASPVY